MLKEDWKKYINIEKEKYKMIGQVACPAFGNEHIYFNHYGFYHLIYKFGVPRVKGEVTERFMLLPHVPKILLTLKNVENEERRVKNTKNAYFWTIKSVINNKRVRIIIRRLGNNGNLHFFSIMNE